MRIGAWQVWGRKKFHCRWIPNIIPWITAERFSVKGQKRAVSYAIDSCFCFDVLGTKEKKKRWVSESTALYARGNVGRWCVWHFGGWGCWAGGSLHQCNHLPARLCCELCPTSWFRCLAPARWGKGDVSPTGSAKRREHFLLPKNQPSHPSLRCDFGAAVVPILLPTKAATKPSKSGCLFPTAGCTSGVGEVTRLERIWGAWRMLC